MHLYIPLGTQICTHKCICLGRWSLAELLPPPSPLHLPSSSQNLGKDKPMWPLSLYSPALGRQVVLILWCRYPRTSAPPQQRINLPTYSCSSPVACVSRQPVHGDGGVPQQPEDKDFRASLDSNFNMESLIKSCEEIGHSGTGMGSNLERWEVMLLDTLGS